MVQTFKINSVRLEIAGNRWQLMWSDRYLIFHFVRRVFLDAPRITIAPRDQKVIEEGSVNFYCRASGNPVPEVYWRRGGRRITANHQRYTVVNVPMTSQTSSSNGGSSGSGISPGVAGAVGGTNAAVLRIEPVKARKDDVVLECVADNQVGEPAVATARLDVYAQSEGRYT